MERQQLIAWAAGFFDGEGYVRIAAPASGRSSGYLKINVTQVDRRSLNLLVDLFGGSITRATRSDERYRVAGRWELQGRKATAALEEMLPYLVVKREHATIGIEYGHLLGEPRKKIDALVLEQRAATRGKLLALRVRESA